MHRASYAVCCAVVALLGCWSSFERPSDDLHERASVRIDGGAGTGGSAGTASEPIVEDAGRVLIDDPSDRCNAQHARDRLVARDGETCYELLAHNGGWEGDPLKLVQDEHINQLYYDIPWPEGSIATRFGVQQDDHTSLHRALVFESNFGTHGLVEHDPLGVFGMDSTLIAGWAVGGCNVELPSDMGLALASPSSGKKLMVQWHHFNLTGDNQYDASRVQICVVPQSARAHVGSITVLGTENLGGVEGMPSGVESTYGGSCPNRTAEPITIVALWPHMHRLGTGMRAEIITADDRAISVFDHPFWHEENVHYLMTPEVVVAPGETLRTSCTYFNTGSYSTGFGLSLIHEMCYQFAFAYPAGALDKANNSSLLGATNTCLNY